MGISRNALLRNCGIKPVRMSKNTNFAGYHISCHLLKPQESFEEVAVRIGRRYINTEFLFMLPTLRPKASRYEASRLFGSVLSDSNGIFCFRVPALRLPSAGRIILSGGESLRPVVGVSLAAEDVAERLGRCSHSHLRGSAHFIRSGPSQANLGPSLPLSGVDGPLTSI